jgi:DNA-binding transcriptional LysR family regulator
VSAQGAERAAACRATATSTAAGTNRPSVSADGVVVSSATAMNRYDAPHTAARASRAVSGRSGTAAACRRRPFGLRAGDVDVAVVVEPGRPGEVRDDDLTRAHLLDDPYAVLLPADSRHAAAREVDLADLAAEPWVQTASAPGQCHEAAQAACLAAGFTPSYAVLADEYPATQGFVAAGLGVALVPHLALGLVHERVVVRPLCGVQPVRHVYAAVRAARSGEALVRAALDALRTAAASLRAPGA